MMLKFLKTQSNRSAFARGDVQASELAHIHREKHPHAGEYLGDLVLGGIDGIVTTFAIVAGVAGASLSPGIVLILGFANLIADGFSMAVGNYLGTKSDQEFQDSERQREVWEVENLPEHERDEIREIYKEKGFEGELLENIVSHITSNKDLWVDTMMREELGIIPEKVDAKISAFMTFVSFVTFGFLPLSVYFFYFIFNLPVGDYTFQLTCLATAIGLFLVGALRSFLTMSSAIKNGFEILILGGMAGGLAYWVGYALRAFADGV